MFQVPSGILKKGVEIWKKSVADTVEFRLDGRYNGLFSFLEWKSRRMMKIVCAYESDCRVGAYVVGRNYDRDGFKRVELR